MAITYDQLQSWEPGDLDAAAEELNAAVRKKLVDQQDEMDAGKPPGSWVGISADAAVKRPGSDGGSGVSRLPRRLDLWILVPDTRRPSWEDGVTRRSFVGRSSI